MNKSLNVFLSVLLCAVLCVGVLTSLSTTDDSASQYSQKEYTSSIPTGIGAPSGSFGVGARGNDLAVPMSSRRSSREQYLQPSRQSTGVANLQGFSRSANSTGMLSLPSLQGGDGGRLFTHMSSSQTMKSFGGGSNSAGVSMSGGVVSTNNLTTSSPNSLLSLSPNNLTTSSSNNLISSPTSLLFLSPNNLITSSPLAANYQGLGNTTIGGSRGISGRQNANGAIYNSWWYWLSTHNTATGQDDGNGNLIYTYSKGELEALYESFVEYWSKNFMAEIPGFDEWLSWYISSTGESGYVYNDDTYRYIPVGNIMSLFIFAFIYCGYVYFRIRKGRKINTDF